MEAHLTDTLLAEEKMGPSSPVTRPSAYLRVAAYVIAFSSFLWGYGFTVLNVCIAENAKGSILLDFNLTDAEIELASSLVLIGAWFTAVATASLADTYGRRVVLLVNNVLFIVGALLCALATSKDTIYIGRTIIGFACGIVTNVTPILLAEIAPANIRGQITTLHQLMLTIGILGSSVLGYALVTSVPSGWRKATVVSLWRYKKPMLLGTLLVFFQAMTGINTVMLYSSKIFHFAGVDNSIMATASVGTINVLATVVSVVLVDTCGRKILLLLSSGLMAASLGVLSYSLLTLTGKIQGVLAVVCVLVFVAGFAIGLGAVIWYVELTPSSIRSRAMGFFMAVSYACNVFVATCTLGIIQALGTGPDVTKNGIAKLYLICWYGSILHIVRVMTLTSILIFGSGLAVACFLFIWGYVPETKNITVSQIVTERQERGQPDDDDDQRDDRALLSDH
ncbi:hypothetical protein DYB38_004700 [Aphanomyces astaci]|uniref:Major facilitator superfamily (MFS) profile domain-containing protein n=1 Tax=Aphanomyces astaci TaxID=112090 RepID=A0A397DA12_APHAT|nr:hypothetical protein DYB36_007825 [Aphanomyces astaci]RHY61570.1 hypothetical protein DYB38_004700 [Aphanomyces astaci]